MNLLLDPLPQKVNGKRINSNFRNMVLFEQMMQDCAVPENCKISLAIDYFYMESVDDIKKAVDGLLWFYTCGESKYTSSTSGKNSERIYDFEQDAAYIYADFLKVYGIDLNSIEYLHWWKFRALFLSLPDTAKMSEIIRYRCADISSMKGEEKKYYQKMKDLYRIKSEFRINTLSAAAESQQFKNKLHSRYEKAQQWAKDGGNH